MIRAIQTLAVLVSLWRKGLIRPVLRWDGALVQWQATPAGLAVAAQRKELNHG